MSANPTHKTALLAGPILALLAGYLMSVAGFSAGAAVTLGITVLCIVWWLLEPIPIPATSLLPLALLPLFGVLNADEIAGAYGNPLILLLLGGFILSTALAGTSRSRWCAPSAAAAAAGSCSDSWRRPRCSACGSRTPRPR
jgi:sodium-dependent dicarboxylate transporter 2/3/5